MNTHGAPKFEYTPEPNEDNLPEELKTRLDGELSVKLIDMLDKLESKRNPDSIRHDFTFHGDSLRALYVPKELHAAIARYGQIDEVTISTSQLEATKSQPADMVIRFELSSDVDDATYYIYVNHQVGMAPAHYKPNHVYDELGAISGSIVDDVPAVNSREINRIVGSLINNSPAMHESAYDKQPWLNTKYFQLTDKLVDASSYYEASGEYVLTDAEGGPAGYYGFTEADGDMVERYIYHIDVHHIDISANGNLGYYEKGVEVVIDNSEAKRTTTFVEHVTKDDTYESNIKVPSAEDYEVTFAFIAEQHHIELERKTKSE